MKLLKRIRLRILSYFNLSINKIFLFVLEYTFQLFKKLRAVGMKCLLLRVEMLKDKYENLLEVTYQVEVCFLTDMIKAKMT